MKAIMIIVIAVCGHGNGSGCGVDIDRIEFSTLELCLSAAEEMFPDPSPGASWDEMNSNWQPQRDIRCVNG